MDNQAQMPDLANLKRVAEAATQGEWQVIETELPCRIGRPHVERRIFTVKHHPQLKGPYPIVNGSVALGTDESPVHHMVSITASDAEFIAAANPSAVLALIAENELLLAELAEMTKFRDNAANHMRRIRSEATSFEKERDQLKGENELLASSRAKLAGELSRVRARHKDWSVDAAMGEGEQS